MILGGNKVGDDRWYKKNIQLADKLFTLYLDKDNMKKNT
ncbi:MAG: hypothetical protein ACJAZX_001256 [Rickettsiales bacterium]